MPPIDLSWVLIIAVFWVGILSALVGIVWFAGAYFANRDEQRQPLAPLVELDLHRSRQQRAAQDRRRRGMA